MDSDHVAESNPYEILGVPAAATDAEVKAAYLAAVRAHPPEREPEAFKSIRAAYEQLRTPERRLATDMLRLQPWPHSTVSGLPARADGSSRLEGSLQSPPRDAPPPEPREGEQQAVHPAASSVSNLPVVEQKDIVRAARAFTDLGRRDFPEDFRKIKDLS